MDVPATWIEPDLRELLKDRHTVGAPAPAALRVALAALVGGDEVVTISCYGRYEDDESFWQCLAFTRSRMIQVTARRAGEHWSYYSDGARDGDVNDPPPEITGTSRFLRDVRRVSLVSPLLQRHWDRFADDPSWRWTTGIEISFGDGNDVVTPPPSGRPNDREDDEHVAQVLALLADNRV